MPSELELEQGWDRLQRALERLSDQPTAENRAQLREASRHLSGLWRSAREAVDAFVQGNEGQLVLGASASTGG